MATRRLYYDDSFQDNFSAQVLSCEPLTEAEDGGFGPRWGVILDQTLLYPTSGGQPHDLGKLGDANVVDVREKDDDRIVHFVDRPVPAGRIDGCIDWPRRFDHMQQHTGQHLLSAVFQERFGLVTVSFHLGETASTIDLHGPQPTSSILQGAARAANAAIFEDREIAVRYGAAEEFAGQGIRKQVDRKGILRAIEITGIDLQPCGGTHLRHTGQLGLILIRGCNKIRQDWRVEFVCGRRAETAARQDAELLARLSAQLKSAPQDLSASVERLLREREASAKRLKTFLPKVAEADAAKLLASTTASKQGARVVAELFEGVEPDYLQHLASALAQTENVIALLADKKTGHLVFAQNPKAGKDMNAVLKKVFEQFAGKGGGTKDFARGALTGSSDSQQALVLTQKLV
ncbi:MAG TPA: DHHA1 domain-containing protein [Candidatus Acidoferrum sp.]|jgi:alanyl-tRNA synthetase